MPTHTEWENYSCNWCGKSSSKRSNPVSHMKMKWKMKNDGRMIKLENKNEKWKMKIKMNEMKNEKWWKKWGPIIGIYQ